MTTIVPSGALCYDEDELAHRMGQRTEILAKKRSKGSFFPSFRLDLSNYYYKDWIDYSLSRDKAFDGTLTGKHDKYGVHFLIPHGRGPVIGGGMEDRYGLYEVSSETNSYAPINRSTDDYRLVLIDGYGVDRPCADILSRYFTAFWQAQ